MKYFIDEINLALLARAKAQAKLALEPRPNYKPGSREVLISALTNLVDTIDALEFDESAPPQKLVDAVRALKELPGGDYCDPEGSERLCAVFDALPALPMTREKADADADAFVDLFSELTGKNIVAVDCPPPDDYLAKDNPNAVISEMSGDTIRATQEEPVE